MPRLFVIREEHKKFVTFDYEFILNRNLSALAKALHVFFLAMPRDWIIRDTYLRKHFKEGERALAIARKNLAKEGYLHYMVQRNEQKNIREYSYLVYERPGPQEAAKQRALELGWELLQGKPKVARRVKAPEVRKPEVRKSHPLTKQEFNKTETRDHG